MTDERWKQFAELVRDMRGKQREFFDPKRRRPSTVGESKALERRVDVVLDEILGPEGDQGQARLF